MLMPSFQRHRDASTIRIRGKWTIKYLMFYLCCTAEMDKTPELLKWGHVVFSDCILTYLLN